MPIFLSIVRAWRAPGFVTPVVAALAAGLAGVAVVIAIADSLLWRPLPVSRPGELVELCRSDANRSACAYISYPEFADFGAQPALFSGVAGYSMLRGVIRSEIANEALFGEIVTSSYFDVLGLHPVLGRFFSSTNDRDPEKVAVISYEFWHRAYGGATDAIGKAVIVNGQTLSVIGVAPKYFRGLYLQGIYPKQVWVSLPVGSLVTGEEVATFSRTAGAFAAIARLTPASNPRMFDDFVSRLKVEYPDVYSERQFFQRPLSQDIYSGTQYSEKFRNGAAIATIITLTVLAVACLNIAALLATAIRRRTPEFQLRRALGASTGAVVGQVLLECAVLVVAAGVLAAVLTAWILPLITGHPPPALGLIGVSIDPTLGARVVGILAILTIFSLVVVSVAPVTALVRATRLGINQNALSETPRAKLRTIVVAGTFCSTVALAIVALSLYRALSAEIASTPIPAGDRTVVASFLLGHRAPSAEVSAMARARLSAEILALGGVGGLGFSDAAPLSIVPPQRLDVRAEPDGGITSVVTRRVTPGVLGAMSIPLQRGRLFSESDGGSGQKVAVVSEAFCQRVYGTCEVVGARFLAGREKTWTEIIGIVGDVVIDLGSESSNPVAFFPLANTYRSSRLNLVVGFDNPALANTSAQALTEAARRASPDLGLLSIKTLEQLRLDVVYPQRMAMTLMGILAGLALAIACVGAAGLAIALVQGNRKSAAIRLALGASGLQAHSKLIGQCLWIVMASTIGGIVVGRSFLTILASTVGVVHDPNFLAQFSAAAAVTFAVIGSAYLCCRSMLRSEPAEVLRST